MQESTDAVRLAKRLAETLGCSRANAEHYIAGGWVRVDGVVVEEAGYRVAPQQQVELMADANLTPLPSVTLLLNKPAGIAADGVLAGPSALQCLDAASLQAPPHGGVRFLRRHLTGLTLCGGLETEASGLLIWTQDWRIARKLVEEAARVEQEYVVEVRGALGAEGLALLNHGLPWNGKPLAPMKVSWQNETRLRFAGKGVQVGQIRHMCRLVGVEVVSMRRLRVGRQSLAGLAPGQWRYLAGYERF